MMIFAKTEYGNPVCPITKEQFTFLGKSAAKNALLVISGSAQNQKHAAAQEFVLAIRPAPNLLTVNVPIHIPKRTSETAP